MDKRAWQNEEHLMKEKLGFNVISILVFEHEMCLRSLLQIQG